MTCLEEDGQVLASGELSLSLSLFSGHIANQHGVREDCFPLTSWGVGVCLQSRQPVGRPKAEAQKPELLYLVVFPCFL